MVEQSARGPIGYYRETVPSFDTPAYEGERYEVMAPDTLDWQDRALLAVNGLSGPTDPKADYEVWWRVLIRGDRPIMLHDNNDQVQNEMQRSLVLMRLMSGSDLNEEVDRAWMKMLLHMQGPDGLLYYPMRGRPWQRIGLDSPQYGGLPEGDHITGPLNNGVILAAIALYYLRSGNEIWKDLGMGVVDGLSRLGVDRGDYIYYPKGMYGLGEVSDPAAPMSHDADRNHPMGWMAQGLMHFARATGHEPAMTLAGKMIRALRFHAKMYADDGEWLPDNPLRRSSIHFHMHSYPLVGMLEHALATGDREMVEFVRVGYECGKDYGETLTGFFPENVRTARPQTSELCEVADMIALGLKLSSAGVGDYWDDADRWIRNIFAEGQLTRYDWMYRVGGGKELTPGGEIYCTDERVGERNIGAFAGWPAPNDFFGARHNGHHNVFMHCCTATATRTLYYIWQHGLNYEDGRLKVNLLMNRASRWADVDSHIPYQGQVDVKIKRSCDLSVRIPEWVTPAEVRAQVNGADRQVLWDGRFCVVGHVAPPDTVTLSFPIAERSDTIWAEKKRYTIVRKGNDVVAIDPPGRYAPLYQRSHYRQDTTRWRKVQRYVPAHLVDW